MTKKKAAFLFAATCPRCKVVHSQSSYGSAELSRLLDEHRPVEASCDSCGKRWTLISQDRALLREDLRVFLSAKDRRRVSRARQE